MRIAEIRAAGRILGREKLAQRALVIATEIVKDGSYKRAIEGAGQLKAIADACSYEEYWGEKAGIGEDKEQAALARSAASKPAHG